MTTSNSQTAEQNLSIGQEVFLTKYALTKGILKRQIHVVYSDNRISFKGYLDSYLLNQDVFLTESEALEAAEKMRLAKIKSVEKQLVKLQNLKFKVK